MTQLRVTLLGDFQARLGAGAPLRLRTRKTQGLLAYLASPPGQGHSRDKLAALLWGELSQTSARSRLRETLFALRRALAPADPPCLEVGSETLALTADAVDVDAMTFERLAQTDDPAAVARAVELYRGDLLEGLAFRGSAFEDWLMAERERLRELAVEVLAKLLAYQRSSGDPNTALRTALRLVALDPLQEVVHRTVMRLYAQLGRRDAALRQYQHCVSTLQRDLGVEPEDETRRLYQDILGRRHAPPPPVEADSGRPGLGGTAAVPGHERLVAPTPVAANATPLIGRARELTRLRERLRRARDGTGAPVAIDWEPGVGKTRLIGEIAERKQVTVLFADLKGSMELLADLDPEEARKILDPVLERMMDAVHRYEGTLSQVMGEGIMAVFGAPLAHEDHAVRACYAALRMQELVKRYQVEMRRAAGVPVAIRVGLNSGEVVVRPIGSDLHVDYTAVGQTTYLATRIAQAALPGSVVITPDTLRLAEGFVEVRPLSPTPVKGMAEPVKVYELTGGGPARTRFQAATARGLTRFVGRATEVDQLRRALDRATAGHGQVVAIVGEAGVGKSRFVYEFTRSARVQGWLILESASVSYGTATAYLPVIDLLKGYFKIQDRDDQREVRDKVIGRMLALDRALESLLSPILALLDVPVDDPGWAALDPPQRRQRTLEAVKRLLLRESQVQPLLLVIEDLHWIDSETQALLDSLVDSLGSVRVLLLVNYRPEYEHRWSRKTYYTHLRLESLTPESASELLQTLLGDARELEPLKQMLRRRGNPLFLEETVRTLVETKALDGERGAYRLVRPVQNLQIPATAQAILAARIDRLPMERKRLLQTASVIGKDVPFAILTAIAELPEEALRRALGHLQEAEFLYETTLFPDLEYTFKHALTHEVAYGSLLQERRRTLHAGVVEAIERLYADRLAEQVENLAHHAFRGEVWDEALAYLRQAGARALARSAYQEAAVYFEQAAAAVDRLPRNVDSIRTSIDLRIDLRTALQPLGDTDRLSHHLQVGERLASELGDHLRLARIVAFQAHLAWAVGDPIKAIVHAERALTLAEARRDFGSTVLATYYLGMACNGHGDYRRGIQVLTANVDRLPAELAGERFGMGLPASVATRVWLAFCLADVGRFGEARAHADEAVRIAKAVGQQPYSDLHSRLAVGVVACAQGHFGLAIPSLEGVLEVGRHSNIHLMDEAAMGWLGYAHLLAGRLSEAVAVLDGPLSVESHGDNAIHFLAVRAEARLRMAEPGEAERLAGRALELCRHQRLRGWEAHSLRVLAEIAAHPARPEVGKAVSHYREAMTLAEELGMRPLIAHCHLGLGKLYRRTGTREPAHEHLTTATTMYREMGMTYWLEKVEAEQKT